MNRAVKVIALLSLTAVAGCMETTTDPILDSGQQYFQRADKITLSAGNAKDVNTRVQEIDPWPRYVGNNAIPGNGERMAGAAERYRDVSKQNRAPQPLPLVGSAGAAGAPPVQGQ